jgi:trehalose synthase
VREVDITANPVDRFGGVLPREDMTRFTTAATDAAARLAGHHLWHLNSTAEGGGVAEMLQSILGYLKGCDVPVRWLVINGNEDFFVVTKRLHHLLHGRPGDGGPLGDAERKVYESALADELPALLDLVEAGDVAVLHDPQTLGLAPALAEAGVELLWACHIGADEANDHTRLAWEFLAPYTAHTRRQVFSRRQYAWEVLDPAEVAVIPPCIDAFSAKNEPLDDEAIRAILDAAGVIPDPAATGNPTYVARDGELGRITHRATMIEDDATPADAAVVLQVSRWDPLKDHVGVMTGFCENGPDWAHLILAGPDPDSVSDDPEGKASLDELTGAWRELPAEQRRRVHIACLPMDDVDENAAVVNALQRRATVVVQKSLAEGFGLTVAEAMWKARPVVGSRVGGIQDQVEHDVSGVLIDPTDLAMFGKAVTALLDDPDRASEMGRRAHDRACRRYLAPCHLTHYLELITGPGAGG